MKITLKQLEVFVAIGKCGTMSAAAKAIHLTQSACSMAIAALESQLGHPLFDRLGKRLVLNTYGTALLPKAINVLLEANTFQNIGLAKNKAIISGELIIGASSTISNYLLPQLIAHFTKKHPTINIHLHSSNTEQTIRQLLKFQIDFGLVEGECSSNKIEVIPWQKDELIIIASANYPLVKKTNIVLNDLLQETWIVREQGSGTRKTLERALGMPIMPYLELDQTEAIKSVVALGCGISCLSRSAVIGLLRDKKLVEIKTPFLSLSRDYSILFHKEKTLGLQTGLFVDFMLKKDRCKKRSQ